MVMAAAVKEHAEGMEACMAAAQQSPRKRLTMM